MNEVSTGTLTREGLRAVLERNDGTRKPTAEEVDGLWVVLTLTRTEVGIAETVTLAMGAYRAVKDKQKGALPAHPPIWYVREIMKRQDMRGGHE